MNLTPTDCAALARELAEKLCPDINNPMPPCAGYARGRAMAILLPALERLAAERDQALKENLLLENDAYMGDDDEKRELRAEVERLKEVARRQYWALREGDNIVRYIRCLIFPGWTNASDHDVNTCLRAYEQEHGITPNYAIDAARSAQPDARGGRG